MKKLALFASGTGSNVFNILTYFKDREDVKVVSVLSNNPEAGALQHAKNFGVETLSFDKKSYQNVVLSYLKEKEVDFIVLAGFLWLIPESFVQQYPHRIINVHPALLPNYGGKGMYGMNVHKAVIANGETKSGITIHQVNEHYDEGTTIAQFECDVNSDDTAESLAKKIHALEKEHFPATIDKHIQQLNNKTTK